MNDTLISTRDIVVARRAQAVLDGAAIDLSAGEIVALIGANGAGKTTLFHVIAGFLTPQRGTLRRTCSTAQIALLADRPALYPDWSVRETLQRLARLYRADDGRVPTLIAQCGLAEVTTQKAKNLSHGYQQRLAMAQMLLASPRVVLLDEPGNGLDHEQRRALWPLLRSLKASAGVMLISHDWEEVGAVADRVYVVKGGRCHELDLPPRQSAWRWLVFRDAESARAACPQGAVYDGRFVAATANTAYDGAALLAMSEHYPAQALQEKIDALA